MNDTGARHPNRFLADLTLAMHSTAETARQATIDQCQADAKAYTEQLHARKEDETASLRKAAEADVIAIREWSKAEVERIRLETEQRISRRRELLDQELQEYNSGIAFEIERVQKRVQSYQDEIAQYFEQLLQEPDPTTFASMGARMPEPPDFTDADRGHLATDIRALREQIMRSGEVAEIEAVGAAAAPEDVAQEQPEIEDVAAAAPEDVAQEQPEIEDVAAAVPEDFAQEQPEIEEAVVPRTDRRGAAAASQPAGPESTQVVVVGLVSVASIVAFKRQLSRLPGVKSVGVSSGPDGEFVFTVSHSLETSLGSLIPTIPAFQATVISEREGVLNVSASDPEAEG